jgi:hypothetical protein
MAGILKSDAIDLHSNGWHLKSMTWRNGGALKWLPF